MTIEVRPEPDEDEREAILAALAGAPETPSRWAETALREGVEEGEQEA